MKAAPPDRNPDGCLQWIVVALIVAALSLFRWLYLTATVP